MSGDHSHSEDQVQLHVFRNVTTLGERAQFVAVVLFAWFDKAT